MTQEERIIRHIEDYGSISSLEAVTEYGIMRLASRVHDLKRKGYAIVAENESGKNRYGEPCHWTRYKLFKEDKQDEITL